MEDKTIFVPNTGAVSQIGGDPRSGAPEESEATPPPAPGAAGGEEIAKVSLNGAQISSILEITQAVAAGAMERESAITLLTEAFPFDQSTADKILGDPRLPAQRGVDENEG